jgi:hypothetical protein
VRSSLLYYPKTTLNKHHIVQEVNPCGGNAMRKVKILVVTWLIVAVVVSSGVVFGSRHRSSPSTDAVAHPCNLHSGNPLVMILQAQ